MIGEVNHLSFVCDQMLPVDYTALCKYTRYGLKKKKKLIKPPHRPIISDGVPAVAQTAMLVNGMFIFLEKKNLNNIE